MGWRVDPCLDKQCPQRQTQRQRQPVAAGRVRGTLVIRDFTMVLAVPGDRRQWARGMTVCSGQVFNRLFWCTQTRLLQVSLLCAVSAATKKQRQLSSQRSAVQRQADAN